MVSQHPIPQGQGAPPRDGQMRMRLQPQGASPVRPGAPAAGPVVPQTAAPTAPLAAPPPWRIEIPGSDGKNIRGVIIHEH